MLAMFRGEQGRARQGVAVTDQIRIELALDLDEGILEVGGEDLAATSEAEAHELARRNLMARSKEPWTQIADGLFQSPWNDGFDCARLALPTLFPRIGVKGDPIATLPTRNAMLVTGSEELAGLRALYGATRALAEQERGLYLGALRLENGAWRDLDRRDGAVVITVPALSHLLYLQDALDYAVVGAQMRAVLEAEGYSVEPLESGDRGDGVIMTFTSLPRVANVVIPYASLVRCNDDFLPWQRLADVLGKNLVPLEAVWPPHYQVRRLPTLVEIEAAKLR